MKRPAGRPHPARQALQAVLAAEQAAVYGYGIIGAHLAGPDRSAAIADWVAHQASRDELTGLLRARGAVPAAAAVAYQLPGPVQHAAQSRSLAVLLEDGVTAGYLGLVALDDRALRQLGAQRVTQSAERAAFWRGGTIAFPGLRASALAAQPRRS